MIYGIKTLIMVKDKLDIRKKISCIFRKNIFKKDFRFPDFEL